MPGHGHLFEQQGAGFVGATFEGVVGGAGDVGQHVLQAAGDGDFLHGVGDLAVFHPEAGGAARVVAGEGVDALAHEFGNQQAAAHFAQEFGLALVGMAEDEVVGAAGVGGGGQAELAGAVAAEEVALDDAVFNHKAGAGGDAFGIEGGAGQRFVQVRLFAQAEGGGEDLAADAVLQEAGLAVERAAAECAGEVADKAT